jgi:hypothetical protein
MDGLLGFEHVIDPLLLPRPLPPHRFPFSLDLAQLPGERKRGEGDGPYAFRANAVKAGAVVVVAAAAEGNRFFSSRIEWFFSFLRAVYTRVFASVSPSAMAPLPNSFLCFSLAITYEIMQRKQLGGGSIADGETDAKNASVDGPLFFHPSFGLPQLLSALCSSSQSSSQRVDYVLTIFRQLVVNCNFLVYVSRPFSD